MLASLHRDDGVRAFQGQGDAGAFSQALGEHLSWSNVHPGAEELFRAALHGAPPRQWIDKRQVQCRASA
jgi:hypothetical protein